MKENKSCKKGNHEVSEEDFYKQGNRCKTCRNEMIRIKREAKKGVELADYLLHQSCIRAFARVRGQGNKGYIGVKCQWEKPALMKEALIHRSDFWFEWLKQTEIHEKSGRLNSTRPTLDRIEADPLKNGHYYLDNLQVLSASENTLKAKEVKCIFFLIKDLKIVEVSTFDSVNKMMKSLKIVGHNVISIKRDTGLVSNIGNGYSLLTQTIGGQLKEKINPLYKRVIRKRLIMFDKVTGEETVVREIQEICETGGIWFDLKANLS